MHLNLFAIVVGFFVSVSKFFCLLTNDRMKKDNDLCEGILGLNDWLQKVTPNLSQQTVSTKVEVLRNSMMPSFLKQDKETKDKLSTLLGKGVKGERGRWHRENNEGLKENGPEK